MIAFNKIRRTLSILHISHSVLIYSGFRVTVCSTRLYGFCDHVVSHYSAYIVFITFGSSVFPNDDYIIEKLNSLMNGLAQHRMEFVYCVTMLTP